MSTLALKPDYAELLARTLPKVIETEEENEHYLKLLEELDSRQGQLTSAEKRLAELLTLLVEEFETRHYQLKKATPRAVLAELMQLHGLKQKDLVAVFGTPSIVSEVLAGKRNLTTEHIRKLSRRFGVSPELFL